MKKLLLTLMLFSTKNAFAYSKHWIPLYGDLMPTVQNASTDGVLPIIEPADEHDLGVLTLSFDPGEIGQDTFAVNLLAGSIAAKHGGNKIYYVSGTEWKNTGEVASQTYRVIWKGGWPPKVNKTVVHKVNKTSTSIKLHHEISYNGERGKSPSCYDGICY